MLALVFLAVAASGLNPITRVAELLEGLSKKVEMDGKAEQDLYDAYKCWCKKVMTSKSLSIEDNKKRIIELEAYIDDLSNGRVELTSERGDLEAEITDLEKALAEANDMRKKEHDDFVAAKNEMDMAVNALDRALTTLQTATSGYKDGGVLTSISSELKQVLKSDSGFLAKRDVEEVHRLLDVPEADWNKLNRDATFKMKYAARSTKIQDVLQDMYNTFVDNRDEAVDNENKAVSDFNLLTGGKKESLRVAKQALLDKSGETGARNLALGEANAEKTDLEGQNTRDTTFFQQTKQGCNRKASDWEERKRLRSVEIASISEAIGILRSDDARDTFSSSFESQSFIQLNSAFEQKRDLALSALRKVAGKVDDARISVITTLLAMKQAPAADVTNDPFRDIFTAIDNMVTGLRQEETDDLRNKEYCESERMNYTQEAKILSRKIDVRTESIARYYAQVEAANKTIEEINQEMDDLAQDKRDAEAQRAKESAQYQADKKMDRDAADLVQSAIGVLKKFYTDEAANLALVQKGSEVRAHQPGGVAPPPPPSTFDAGYGGAKGEHDGIVAIMELIFQDIEKDMEKSDNDEKQAIKDFNSLLRDIDATRTALRTRRGGLKGDVSTDMGLETREKNMKRSNKGGLDAKLLFLKQIAPGCDFIAIHFATRLRNRQMELDGLAKAKAILASAILD